MNEVVLVRTEVGANNCDGCSPDLAIKGVVKIGRWYLCAECLRDLAGELDRAYGK